MRCRIPAAVDTAAVAKELPYGTVNVTAVKGGLEVPAESGSDSIIIANAAVIVSFDDGKTAKLVLFFSANQAGRRRSGAVDQKTWSTP